MRQALNPQRYSVVTTSNLGLEVTRMVDYATYCVEGYERNAIVYSCVREIARSAPSARLQVKKRLAQGQTEIWEDHPLQAVLDYPNPQQSAFDFIELLNTYLNLDGNVFIVREMAGKRTTKLWLPRPDRMTPVVARGAAVWEAKGLLGFVYTSESGEKVGFLPDEVFHIKFPNPYDPTGGLGRGIPPLMSAAAEADIDNTATQFTRSIFKNGLVPSGLLKSKNILSDTEVARIRARLRSQYGGVEKAGETMILDADAEYQKMGLDMTEVAFPDLRAISETRICSTFKVPPILVGIKAGLDASTYSNYTQARRSMWEDNIVPTNLKLAEKLTSGLKDELGPSGLLQFNFDAVVALQEDRSLRFARSNQGVMGGWLTVNEARREVGISPVIGGDVFLRPLMSSSVDDGPGDASTKPGKALRVINSEETAKSGKKLLTEGVVDGEEVNEKRYREFDRIAHAHELAFLKAARGRFEIEKQEIEARIRAEKALIKKNAWDEVWKSVQAYLVRIMDDWAAEFEPLIMALTKDQTAAWAAVLGISWDITNPEVENFIRQYAYKFAEGISNSTSGTLRELFARANDEGWAMPRVIDEVQGVYSGWDFLRSEMIARSETIRASNAGAEEAYRQGGVVETEWWATLDERTCDFCGAMHQQKHATGSVWYSQGSSMTVGERTLVMDYGDVVYPPLHPDCRCTVLPVIEE